MKKRLSKISIVSGTMLAMLLGAGSVSAGTTEQEMMMELQKLIKQQQEQLAKQAAQISALESRMGGVQVAVEQKADKTQVDALEAGEGKPVINSKFENVNVSAYGWINRAMLFADNGDSSDTYFVDNSNSQSRFGLNANVGVSDDFNVGAKFEYGFSSSGSSSVNQLESSNSGSFNLRHADLFFADKRYGKLSLGRGSMAADGTSEVDLSGTSIVSYASISDMAGGQYWYDGVTGINTANETAGLLTQVGDAFSDFDGGRKDRVRYDTPTFYGFMGSASAAADDAFDIAVRYNREYGMAKVGMAVAYQETGDNANVDSIYNGSMSVLFDFGLNVTLAGGVREAALTGRDDAEFYYAKLGYRADLMELGKTSFSIDYAQNDDVAVNGGDANSWSVAMVQNIDDWGTEVYIGFRQYMYDEVGTAYDDVNVVMTGARLKF